MQAEATGGAGRAGGTWPRKGHTRPLLGAPALCCSGPGMATATATATGAKGKRQPCQPCLSRRHAGAEATTRDRKGHAPRHRRHYHRWKTRGHDPTFGRSPRKPLQLEAPHRHTVFSLPRQSRL